MQDSEFEQFRELMEGVHSFYVRDMSEFALSVWWQAMRNFDLKAVSEAMNRHVMNPDSGQFMPKPADVVRMFGGRTEDRALTAWTKVDRAVRHVGTYRSVVFDDPVIHRVIHDMGGWTLFTIKTEEEWPFVEKEFVTRYRGFAMMNETPEYPPKLIGITEAQNSRSGFYVEEPVLIGNKDLAMIVYRGGSEKPMIGFDKLSALTEDKK